MITPRASSSPVEIFVPALNEFAHGFAGNVGRKPSERAGRNVK
jgi:hypothetical protein